MIQQDRITLLPFAVTVGVTGHRRQSLPADLQPLQDEISDVLSQLREAAAAIQSEEPQWYSDAPPDFRLLSPLADGADQLAARAGAALGFKIDVILPFAGADYRASLHEDSARDCFDELIAGADSVLELPGEGQGDSDDYVMVGRATVAHCDLLVAVWDGQVARGHGGTAQVVELALRRGMPVIHVDPSGESPTRLLWSGFDPAVVTEKPGTTVRRPFDSKHLRFYFSALFQPPVDPQERRFVEQFCNEKSKRYRARIEYPLLLSIAGVAAFDPRSVRESHCAARVEREWDEFIDNCAGSRDMDAAFDALRAAYARSDHLASRFAQIYRSGHIFNFVLGGIAVCIGLAANILAHYLLALALLEAGVTAAILLNTRLGVRNEWHRKWLDYRQLAERLRPMRSMKLLALAAPDPPGTKANPVPQRWTEWYSLAVWRATGFPCGRIDRASAVERANAIAAHEIGPQVAYHEKHSNQIALLDHRLEKISATLFQLTLIGSMIAIAGLAFNPAIVNRYGAWLTLVGAGFPALGTAVFGIRFQADFGGSAVRSQGTANALRETEVELEQQPSLMRAADLVEQASQTMLIDLDQWRLVNQQQELDLL